MPTEQAKFILDLSQPRVALWRRQEGELTRLIEISVDDSQIVQKLRAHRISAAVDGAPRTDIYLPAGEVVTNRFSQNVSNRAIRKDLAATLNSPTKDVILYQNEEASNGEIASAAIRSSVLDQAAQFAKGAGFEPNLYFCPNIHKSFGETPCFKPNHEKAANGFAKVAAVGVIGSILILASWLYFAENSQARVSSVVPQLHQTATKQKAPLPQVSASAIQVPQNWIQQASYPSEQHSLDNSVERGSLLEIEDKVRNELSVQLAEVSDALRSELAPLTLDHRLLAPYRVAQALDATLTNARLSAEFAPNLRPFTLSRQDPYQFLEVSPKLSPRSQSALAEIVSVQDEKATEQDTDENQTEEIAVLPNDADEQVSIEAQTGDEAEEIAALRPEPETLQESDTTDLSEVGGEVTPEEISTDQPVAKNEVGPQPKLRPKDFQSKIDAIIKEANLPKFHPDHVGFTPKTRPSTISARVREAQESKALEEARIAAEAERKKQEEQEILRKAQEQAVIAEVEKQKQAVKPFAYPKRKPANFARTVARIKSIQKANSVSAGTTVASTGTAATAVPKEPTTNRVQRSGVNKNALSLIGVYGTQASRRALLRTKGGRYRKVQNGDVIAGWRVSAIGESSIRLRKGSRNEVLRMPK